MSGRLSPREVRLVLVGGVVAALLLLLAALAPALSALGGIDARLEDKQAELVAARAVQQQLQALSAGLRLRQAKLGRGGGGSPLALVEATAVRLGCRDNLAAVRPQPTSSRAGVRIEPLELRFEKISLEQLARLLEAFETADQLLKVRTLKARRLFDDPSRLDAVLVVEALQGEG